MLEKLGTGINRIKEAAKRAGLPEPVFKYNFSFLIELRDKTLATPVTQKVTEKVTQNQARIIEQVTKDPFITAKKLASLIGISERKVKENIAKLKKKGVLKRIGPAKGGHWEIIR